MPLAEGDRVEDKGYRYWGTGVVKKITRRGVRILFPNTFNFIARHEQNRGKDGCVFYDKPHAKAFLEQV